MSAALEIVSTRTSTHVEVKKQKKSPDEFLNALFAANIFSSSSEQTKITKMCQLAKLMYMDDLTKINSHFDYPIAQLPTPEALGIQLPFGLKVQAFRHNGEVILAIRGTELSKDYLTLIKNLISDAGIGRHKSNEDILHCLQSTNRTTAQLYEYSIDAKTMQLLEGVIQQRVTGHNDRSRLQNIAGRTLAAFGRGFAKAGTAFSVLGGAAAAGGVALGLASGPLGLGIAGFTALSMALTGAGVSAAFETGKCLTAMEGYPTLLAYIKAIDTYFMQLSEKGLITKNDSVLTVGHSLGGFLAAVIGTMHADEIYSFNGPGVESQTEMEQLIANLGLQRDINSLKSYYSISMETDFIGNLGRRDGMIKHLSIPIIFQDTLPNFPPMYYDSPLAHHGIDLMLQVLNNSSVVSLPPRMLTYSSPKIEEVEDD